jgi:hypothetical protein
MSTYLRHQSFNLKLGESATNAHSWAETEWHSKKRVWLVVLRVFIYRPLWNEFVRPWIILLQVAQHQIGHRNGCLLDKACILYELRIIKPSLNYEQWWANYLFTDWLTCILSVKPRWRLSKYVRSQKSSYFEIYLCCFKCFRNTFNCL